MRWLGAELGPLRLVRRTQPAIPPCRGANARKANPRYVAPPARFHPLATDAPALSFCRSGAATAPRSPEPWPNGPCDWSEPTWRRDLRVLGGSLMSPLCSPATSRCPERAASLEEGPIRAHSGHQRHMIPFPKADIRYRT